MINVIQPKKLLLEYLISLSYPGKKKEKVD